MIQTVCTPAPLTGTIRLPGDKSISHRYAMLAAIAEDRSELHGFARGRDCLSTLRCLRALGVAVAERESSVVIEGRGLRGLRRPAQLLDAGNSGTTMRLLAGILAGQPIECTLTGDDSLSRRPMERIIRPLRLMGAAVDSGESGRPPLTIRGGRLSAIRYELPVASAQVKSCVILAGLFARGMTSVRETIPTRDHTEIALRHFGAAVHADGEWVHVEPDPSLRGRQLEVPADLSSAAFMMVAAALIPGSDIVLPAVGMNRRRRALLTYLRRAGADITVQNEREAAGEPRGDLRVRYSTSFLREALPTIGGEDVAALIDEIPVLAVLGSQIAGGLEVTGAQELRFKESDRIAALAAGLRAMGAGIDELPDGFRVRGAQRLRGADIITHGDHRIAMAFAIAGMAAEGETRIHDAGCADVSFPGFWDIFEAQKP